MALKTFNIDKEVYEEFSKHCKKEGLSMSKKIENFIREEMDSIRSDIKTAIKKIERKNAISKPAVSTTPLEHSFAKYC